MSLARFPIDLATLTLDNKPVISPTALKLLAEKKATFELDVYDSGLKSSGEAMVFFHGIAASKDVFINTNILAHYEKKGVRVIAFDFIGHGNSTKLSELTNLSSEDKQILQPEIYNFFTLAAIAKQLLEKKGIQSAHCVAWSIGGLVAYKLAIDSPSLVKSLVTVATPPIFHSAIGKEEGYNLKFSIDQLSKDKMEAVALHNGIPDIKGTNKYFWDATKKMDSLAFYIVSKNPDQYPIDAKGFVTQTKIPVLMLVPDKDQSIKSSYCESFTKFNNPYTRVKKVAGGHAFFVANPKIFCSLIDSFYLAAFAKHLLQRGLYSPQYVKKPDEKNMTLRSKL